MNDHPLTSPDMERALLGGIMQRPERLPELAAVVHPDDFGMPTHAALWSLLLAMSRDEQPIDLVTVPLAVAQTGAEQRFGGLGYVVELPDHIPSTANLEHYAERVADFSRRRQLRAAFVEATARLDTTGSQEVASGLVQHMTSIQRGERARSVSLREMVGTRLGQLERGEVVEKMSTGWVVANHALGGGIVRQRTYVVAARPAMGKTALMLGLGLSLAKTQGVGIFSLEMSAAELTNRALAGVGGVYHNRIEDPTLLLQDDWNSLTHAESVLNRCDLHIDDRPGLRPSDIEAQVVRWQHTTPNLGTVMIDYLQLVKPDRGLGKKSDEVGETMKAIRDIGRRRNVAIVLLSQLNRGVEARTNKRPVLSDLRESGEIEEAANVVLMLYRERYYDPTSAEFVTEGGRQLDVVEVLVRKNRHGPTGMVRLGFDGPYTRMQEIST